MTVPRFRADPAPLGDNGVESRPDEELRHTSRVSAAKMCARFIEPMLLLRTDRLADDPSRYQYEIFLTKAAEIGYRTVIPLLKSLWRRRIRGH